MPELPEVESVHDLHAWTLTSSLPILTAHVVVTSGEGGGPRLFHTKHLIGQGAAPTYDIAETSDDDDDDAQPKAQPRTASTLTLRAKKADIDAFFKGKLSLDEFRKRVTIALY